MRISSCEDVGGRYNLLRYGHQYIERICNKDRIFILTSFIAAHKHAHKTVLFYLGEQEGLSLIFFNMWLILFLFLFLFFIDYLRCIFYILNSFFNLFDYFFHGSILFLLIRYLSFFLFYYLIIFFHFIILLGISTPEEKLVVEESVTIVQEVCFSFLTTFDCFISLNSVILCLLFHLFSYFYSS